jgi:hypothetical protein
VRTHLPPAQHRPAAVHAHWAIVATSVRVNNWLVNYNATGRACKLNLKHNTRTRTAAAGFGWDSCAKGSTWYKTLEKSVPELQVCRVRGCVLVRLLRVQQPSRLIWAVHDMSLAGRDLAPLAATAQPIRVATGTSRGAVRKLALPRTRVVPSRVVPGRRLLGSCRVWAEGPTPFWARGSAQGRPPARDNLQTPLVVAPLVVAQEPSSCDLGSVLSRS